MDALVCQTHRDLDIIICDDGSTDGTRALCLHHVRIDNSIQYHRSETNRGSPVTFAWSLALASAEFFMWAAHEDYWFPEYVEICLKGFEKNLGVIPSGTIV